MPETHDKVRQIQLAELMRTVRENQRQAVITKKAVEALRKQVAELRAARKSRRADSR